MGDNTVKYILECVKADLLKVPDKKKDWEHITALEIAIERIKQYDDIKQLVDKWKNTQDVPLIENTYSESNRNEKAEYFDQILSLINESPSKSKPCSFCEYHEKGDTLYESSSWDGGIGFDYIRNIKYCPICGQRLSDH